MRGRAGKRGTRREWLLAGLVCLALPPLQVEPCFAAPGSDPAGSIRNRQPVASDDAATTTEGMEIDIHVLANDQDPDADPLRVTRVTRALHGSALLNGDESVRYQPTTGFAGIDRFTYAVSDTRGGTATATVTVRVIDLPDTPVAEKQSLETEEDTALAITLQASDADLDPLHFSILEPPTHGTLQGSPPDVSYLPKADYHGPDHFVFAVEDGRGGHDTATVRIDVRPVPDGPVARDDQAETPERIAIDIPVLANDHDPDGDLLRVVRVTHSGHGTVVVNGDDTVRYQPRAGFVGLDGFAYTITDGRETATATASVHIRDLPDAPVAEEQHLRTNEDTALAITLGAHDPDADPLIFHIQRPPVRGTLRGTAPDVSYLPEADYHGPDHFIFAVEDGRGGRSVARISLRVLPVPDAPRVQDDEADTRERIAVDVPVLANDRDPDGDPLRLIRVTQGANGSVLVNGDDTLRYQPRDDFVGTDGFTYTVSDGRRTATATVTIRVRDVPDAPVAEGGRLQTWEDTVLAITLSAHDRDGDALVFEIERPPDHGTLRGSPPDVSYLPHPDYHGPDQFVFRVEDGDGGYDVAKISLRVLPVSDAPRAADDAVETPERIAVDIPVLENDRDPDGDRLRVVEVTHAANGSVLVNGDDTVRYQPRGSFSGRDGFAYTITDDQGETATATVSVHVLDRPEPPVAEAQQLRTNEDTVLAITLGAHDPDGDPLLFRIERPPAHGTLEGTPPDLSYMPAPDYRGADDFVFAVEDGRGGRHHATVAIDVTSVQDRPKARDDEADTREGAGIDIAVLRNDRDADGDLLGVIRVTQGANGIVLINGDDSLHYRPRESYTGPDRFAYTVSDGHGGTATATVSVRVHPGAGP